MSLNENWKPPSLPVGLIVEEVIPECEDTVTLLARRPGGDAAERGLDLDAAAPGQFVMVWLPRINEKPFTLAYLTDEHVGITVMRRGPFSDRLASLESGAAFGLRGPFGCGFWDLNAHAESDRVALIGGGCGMATLGLLAEALPAATLVQGARNGASLLYTERFAAQVLCTDDGSTGRKGFPTEWLAERIEAAALDAVYTCGPEVMMARVAELCRAGGVACQASLERYMKCGIGVCGQCDCDGRLVCQDGPTFDLAELAGMPSFGHEGRDKTGRRGPL
jgi:dihydroorotate dehydrogenase electron transfer subunit